MNDIIFQIEVGSDGLVLHYRPGDPDGEPKMIKIHAVGVIEDQFAKLSKLVVLKCDGRELIDALKKLGLDLNTQ